jgi:hypothetical protein
VLGPAGEQQRVGEVALARIAARLERARGHGLQAMALERTFHRAQSPGVGRAVQQQHTLPAPRDEVLRERVGAHAIARQDVMDVGAAVALAQGVVGLAGIEHGQRRGVGGGQQQRRRQVGDDGRGPRLRERLRRWIASSTPWRTGPVGCPG